MTPDFLTQCIFEFIGTLVLVLLGDGVVASTGLNRSKGQGGGWVVVTLAWGLAVMCGVLIAGPYSGAHLNPAVTVGMAVAGLFPWGHVTGYVVAQLLGGFCGAVLVYAFYKDHFDATDDPATKLGVFCTMPAIANPPRNLFCEFVGTFLLAYWEELGDYATAGIVFIGALLAYLWQNAKPSTLLMGDAGSRAMGFFLAVLALKSSHPFAFLLAALVFIVDGSLGILKISLKRFLHISILKNTRTPLHDHARKNKGWSDEQVLPASMCAMMPILRVFSKDTSLGIMPS